METDVKNCIHHVVCGDHLVARMSPDFFDTHEPSPLGKEWQLCVKCGEARQVSITEVLDPGWKGLTANSDKSLLGEYDRWRREIYHTAPHRSSSSEHR